MSSPYTKDLGLEVTFKLPSISVFFISKLSTEWSKLIANDFWMSKFIRSFGASLLNGADYENEYIVMEKQDFGSLYEHTISKGYNKLLVVMLSKWKVPNLIYIAAKIGNLDAIKLLIANGADIHAQGDYALALAAIEGRLEAVKLLLANGADIHARNDLALFWAANHNHLELVKVLIANGANIHINKEYALRCAADKGYLEVVKLLLANGADIKAIANNRYNTKDLKSLIEVYNKSSIS